jgi:hypothetical protein
MRTMALLGNAEVRSLVFSADDRGLFVLTSDQPGAKTLREFAG